MLNLVNFINKDTFLIFSTLVLLAGAALLSERSGIINIALEGQLIAGVLGYTLIGFFLKQRSIPDYGLYFIGFGAAIIFVIFLTLIFGFLVVYIGMDQILTALALNIIMLGMASFIIVYLKDNPNLILKEDYVWLYISDSFKTYLVIDGINLSIFYQFFIVLLILLGLHVFLFRTTPGLRIRSCGENPKITKMNGLSVIKYRFQALILGAVLIAFASTFFAEWKPDFNGNVNGFGYLGLSMLILGMRNVGLIAFFSFCFVVLKTLVVSFSGDKYQELMLLSFYGYFYKPKSGKYAPSKALGL